MSCLVATFLVLDLQALGNWRNAFVPGHAGTLAATFGPAHFSRHTVVSLEEGSPLGVAGVKIGDQVSFNRASDAYRVLGTDETVRIMAYGDSGSRAVALQPIPDDQIAQRSSAYAAGFLTQAVCSLFALVLAFMISMRRPESGTMRALAIGLLVDSLDFSASYLPGSALQNLLTHYIRPPLVVPFVLGFLYFSLTFAEDRPPLKSRRFRVAFWTIGATMAGVAIALMIDRLGFLPSSLSIFVQRTRNIVFMGCYSLTLCALFVSWRTSTGINRHRVAWTAACLGVPIFTYFVSNAMVLGQVMSERYLDIYGSLATTVAYVGLGYALLRHRLFNLSFAVNRTLVFTVTSLLLFLAFWLIEQVVHKLVHFDAVENNAMLGGVIAFSLFFAFNRLHHRVDHWIEHLFFQQWRARESELRLFVKKAGYFMDRTSLMTAFSAALDRFSDGAGNAIYLADASGCFKRVQSTLTSAWEHLDVDDDLAVSLRTHRHGIVAEKRGQVGGAQLVLPVLQGNELTGILLLGAKQEVQGYRPDEHAVLEFATAAIGMELARLQLGQLQRQLQQLQQKEELQCREQRHQQQELDTLKAERATFLVALSKLGT